MINVPIIDQGFSLNHVIVDGIIAQNGVGAIVHWVWAPRIPQNVSNLGLSGHNEEKETVLFVT